MNKMLQCSLAAIVILLLSYPTALAQDVHFTQFYNAPFQINPALTGYFNGDTRFMGNYRNQWASVPVGYNTFQASVDHKFLGKADSYNFFSGGLSFLYDYAGFSRLSQANLNINASYTLMLGKRWYASLGGQLGGGQRAFEMGNLTFDNQYNTDRGVFDPTLPTGENFPDQNNGFMTLAAGFNFRYQTREPNPDELYDPLVHRTKFDFGVGFFNINQPNQSFLPEGDEPLPMRISPYLLATVKLTDFLDVVGNAQGQFQGEYEEILLGAAGKVHLNRKPGKQFALQGGVSYRFHEFSDSFSPVIEVFYKNWQAGFSYDVNISGFNVATQQRSGPEFSVRYIISNVRPLSKQKICPLI